MNRKEQYIEKYRKICAGEDMMVHIDNDVITKDRFKEPFDGTWFQIAFTKKLKEYAKEQEHALTILDYGSGTAKHLFRAPEWQGRKQSFLQEMDTNVQCYWCYDPAIPRFNRLPPKEMKFDVVACSEVLEHIPEDYLEETLIEIRSYMKDDGYALFSTTNLKSFFHFDDKENLHITLKNRREWCQLIAKYFDKFYLDFKNDEDGRHYQTDGVVI